MGGIFGGGPGPRGPRIPPPALGSRDLTSSPALGTPANPIVLDSDGDDDVAAVPSVLGSSSSSSSSSNSYRAPYMPAFNQPCDCPNCTGRYPAEDSDDFPGYCDY